MKQKRELENILSQLRLESAKRLDEELKRKRKEKKQKEIEAIEKMLEWARTQIVQREDLERAPPDTGEARVRKKYPETGG